MLGAFVLPFFVGRSEMKDDVVVFVQGETDYVWYCFTNDEIKFAVKKFKNTPTADLIGYIGYWLDYDRLNENEIGKLGLRIAAYIQRTKTFRFVNQDRNGIVFSVWKSNQADYISRLVGCCNGQMLLNNVDTVFVQLFIHAYKLYEKDHYDKNSLYWTLLKLIN